MATPKKARKTKKEKNVSSKPQEQQKHPAEWSDDLNPIEWKDKTSVRLQSPVICLRALPPTSMFLPADSIILAATSCRKFQSFR